MLGKMFGKKAGAAKAEISKLKNKDLAEALVGACLLVAYADGNCDSSEVENLNKQLDAHPSLAGYGADIGKMVDNFSNRLDAGWLIGKTQIMREIKDCTHDANEAEDVFVAAITIAQADGDVDDKEKAILVEIGKALNLKLQDYGFE